MSGKTVFKAYYTSKDLFNPFCIHWGAGWGGCRSGTLDDVDRDLPFLGNSITIDVGMPSSFLGALGHAFGTG